MIWCSVFFYVFLIKLKSLFFFNSYLEMNSSSLFMSILCPFVLLLIFSVVFCLVTSEESKIFFFSFFFLVFFVFMCFLCRNPFLFLLGLEMCVYPMITVIFLLSKGLDKIISVTFMFMINILGSLPFMIFFTSQSYNSFFNFFSINLLIYYSNSVIIFLFFLLILICKLPMFLLHFWLTKAHVSASGSCSMILASLMLKLGSFGLLKFSSFFLKISWLNSILIFSLAAWGSLIMMVVMIRFFDIKYLVACSSIVHMSMVFPLVCFNMSMGVLSGIFMMTGHGLVSFILFYLVSLLYENSQNRSFDMNKSMESIFKTLTLWIFIFLLLNVGIPPFLNFYSEMLTFVVSLKFSYFNCMNLFILMIIPIMFFMQLVSKIIFGKINVLMLDAPNSSVNYYMMIYIFMMLILPFSYY